MSLTKKQQIFVDEYLKDFNATRAAIAAGYSEKTAHAIAWENLRKPYIKSIVDKRVEVYAVGKNERLKLLADIARNPESKDSDRLKAVRMLGELNGDYISRVEQVGDTVYKVELTNADSAD